VDGEKALLPFFPKKTDRPRPGLREIFFFFPSLLRCCWFFFRSRGGADFSGGGPSSGPLFKDRSRLPPQKKRFRSPLLLKTGFRWKSYLWQPTSAVSAGPFSNRAPQSFFPFAALSDISVAMIPGAWGDLPGEGTFLTFRFSPGRPVPFQSGPAKLCLRLPLFSVTVSVFSSTDMYSSRPNR